MTAPRHSLPFLELPGVHAVFTLDDLGAPYPDKPMVTAYGSPLLKQPICQYLLAKDEVCFVGQTVALVIAESRHIAEDAVSQIIVDYEVLPAVVDCRTALDPETPIAHLGTENNLVGNFYNKYGDIEGAFKQADHVLNVDFLEHRGGCHANLVRWCTALLHQSLTHARSCACKMGIYLGPGVSSRQTRRLNSLNSLAPEMRDLLFISEPLPHVQRHHVHARRADGELRALVKARGEEDLVLGVVGGKDEGLRRQPRVELGGADTPYAERAHDPTTYTPGVFNELHLSVLHPHWKYIGLLLYAVRADAGALDEDELQDGIASCAKEQSDAWKLTAAEDGVPSADVARFIDRIGRLTRQAGGGCSALGLKSRVQPRNKNAASKTSFDRKAQERSRCEVAAVADLYSQRQRDVAKEKHPQLAFETLVDLNN